MSLERNFNPNTPERRINIRHLTVEMPQPNELLVFDAKKDVSPEDWRAMTYELAFARGKTNWREFHIQASHMKLIDSSLDLMLDEEAWNGMRGALEEYHRGKDWLGFSECAADMKILDPTIDLGLDEEAWNGMHAMLARERKGHHWWLVAFHAINMKILNPSIQIEFTAEEWQSMKERLKVALIINDLSEFVMLASMLKTLNHSINLELDAEICNRILDEVKKSTAGCVGLFTKHIAGVTILAGERVDISAHGVNVMPSIRKQGLFNPTPPIPEVRKFH